MIIAALRSLALPAVALMALPIACSKSSGSGSPTAASASVATQSSAAPLGSGRRNPMKDRWRRNGFVGMLFHAARELPLRDDQQAGVDKLQDQVKGEDQTANAPMTDFQTDVVAGIKAGKLDTAKIQTDYQAIDKTMQVRQDEDADALNGLHALLDPAQRQSLVTALAAKEAAREQQTPPAPAPAVDAGVADWVKRRTDGMTRELNLDPGQQKQVGNILAKDTYPGPAATQARKDEGKKHLDAILAAFAKDDFDAKKLALGATGQKTAHEPMEREVNMLVQLVPILKQDQRDKLAMTRQRQMGTSPMGGMPGMGMGRPHMMPPTGGGMPPGAPQNAPPGAPQEVPPNAPPAPPPP